MAGKATVPIYHGDDFERMAELRREVQIKERLLDEAKREAEENVAPRRIGDEDEGDAKVAAAKEAHAAARAALSDFIDEASERAEMWVLRPIGHEEFRELLKAHPARKVTEKDDAGNEVEVAHPDDAGWAMVLGAEVNTETYPKALLTFVDPEDEEVRTVEEPFDSVVALRKRIKRLTAGEFDTMWTRAHLLNSGAVADPKSSDFYDGPRRSGVI